LYKESHIIITDIVILGQSITAIQPALHNKMTSCDGVDGVIHVNAYAVFDDNTNWNTDAAECQSALNYR